MEDTSEDPADMRNKKRRGREADPEEKEGGIYSHLRSVFYPNGLAIGLFFGGGRTREALGKREEGGKEREEEEEKKKMEKEGRRGGSAESGKRKRRLNGRPAEKE